MATQAALSAVAATVPTPYMSAPPTEQPGGSAGSPGTYRTGPSVQPRITRTGTVSLAADGTATFDWTVQGALSTTKGIQISAEPTYAGAGTPVCWPTAVSATATSIKCSVLAGSVLSVIGINVLQFSSALLPTGTSVGIIAIPGS